MFTVNDAKQKWCVGAGAINGATNCAGSTCMMWRWGEHLSPQFYKYVFPNGLHWTNRENYREGGMDEPRRPNDVPGSWVWQRGDCDSNPGWAEPVNEAFEHRRGFCGLAGRPEFDR